MCHRVHVPAVWKGMTEDMAAGTVMLPTNGVMFATFHLHSLLFLCATLGRDA